VFIRLSCFERRLKSLGKSRWLLATSLRPSWTADAYCSALSEAKPTKSRRLRWLALLTNVRRNPPAKSQAISEDIELGPTLLQDTSAVPSPDERTPADTGHVHWALEQSIREELDSTSYQQHLAGRFGPQRDLDHFGASHGHGRLSPTDNDCSESQSGHAPHGPTCSSREFGDADLGSPDSYLTAPPVGECSNVFNSEVEEGLGRRRPSVCSFRTDQHVEMVPWLSRQVTIGRNSNFYGLSARDREELGGIEYRSLKILLRILIGESPPEGCCGRRVTFSDLPARTLSRPTRDRRHRSFAVDHAWALALPRVLGIPGARQSVVVSV
jgi:hypothetical protein